MKKVFAMFAVLVMLLSLCAGVAATEAEFTPSVPEKPAPDVVPVPDPEDVPAIALLRDETGKIIGYVYEGCLVITPVSEAETSKEIPEDAKQLLLELYEKLKSGEMELPYDKYNKDMNSENMTIRDLFDVTFLCSDHPEILKQPGVTMDLIFDLGVSAKEEVVVMVYTDGQWKPIPKVVNNGDGTITCTFDEICPVSFSVRNDGAQEGPSTPPDKTSDMDMTLWLVIAGTALVALIAVTVIYRVDMKKRTEK